MNYEFLIPLGAFITCTLLHVIAIRDFPKLNLLDYPERYGLTRKRLPYPTGILAVITFIGFFAAISPWTMQTFGLLLAIFTLGFVSFFDDRTPLPAWLRLIIQILCAFIIFATGTRIYTLTNPLEPIMDVPFFKLDTIDIPVQFSIFNFQFSILLPLISGLFTIFWLLLTMNALNWFDGIPGQVSVLSTIGFLVIGILSLSDRVNQPELAMIAFILAGISLACLLFDIPINNFQFSIFNFQFPKVLLGDSGAIFFGLMLGVLTIYAGGKVATAFLVLGVPLIDLFLVILRRIFTHNPLMHGNTHDQHLHHRLLAKGWSERKVIMLTATLGTVFGVSALFLSTSEKFVSAIVLFGVMVGLSYYSRNKL